MQKSDGQRGDPMNRVILSVLLLLVAAPTHAEDFDTAREFFSMCERGISENEENSSMTCTLMMRGFLAGLNIGGHLCIPSATSVRTITSALVDSENDILKSQPEQLTMPWELFAVAVLEGRGWLCPGSNTQMHEAYQLRKKQ